MPRATHNGWAGFHGIGGDGPAAYTATADLINILDTVEVPIVVVGRDLAVACFNQAAADVLDLSPSDVGRASQDIPVLAGSPRLEEQCSRAIASGLESRVDLRDRDKWYVVRISPYPKDDRQIDGIVLTFTNVTAFRASIDQAIYEREFTKAILNTVAHPLVVLRTDQRIQSGNRAFYTMFGVSRDETQGASLSELVHGAFEFAPVQQQLAEMLAGSHAFQPVEVDRVITAGGERTLVLDARPLSFPGHPERRVLMTFQDITARKQAEAAKDLRSEEELRRSEAKIQRLVEANVVGIVMWTLAGAITGANEAFLRMMRYSREDLASGRVRWMDQTPLEWREADERALTELKETGIFQPFEKEYFRKDGSRVPILMGGALFEGSGNEGVAFILDLSEQKRAEEVLRQTQEDLRKAQAEFAHVNRVMTMGELTASIAHEVNQPLASILSSGDSCMAWLANEPPNLERARAAANRIVQAATQASEIVHRIRTLFKSSTSMTASMNVNQAIEETISLVQGETQRKNVTLRTELGAGLPCVEGDRVQLQQVILNLMMNGIEAMAGLDSGPKWLLIRSAAPDQRELRVSIADTGPGIDAEHAGRLFAPFFTTKPQGLGMGLRISRSIIEAHGGRLWAEKNDPRGAVFHFSLPIHPANE